MSGAVRKLLSRSRSKLWWALSLQGALLLLLLLVVLLVLLLSSRTKAFLMLKVMPPGLCMNLPLRPLVFPEGRELKDGGCDEWRGDIGVQGA